MRSLSTVTCWGSHLPLSKVCGGAEPWRAVSPALCCSSCSALCLHVCTCGPGPCLLLPRASSSPCFGGAWMWRLQASPAACSPAWLLGTGLEMMMFCSPRSLPPSMLAGRPRREVPRPSWVPRPGGSARVKALPREASGQTSGTPGADNIHVLILLPDTSPLDGPEG